MYFWGNRLPPPQSTAGLEEVDQIAWELGSGIYLVPDDLFVEFSDNGEDKAFTIVALPDSKQMEAKVLKDWEKFTARVPSVLTLPADQQEELKRRIFTPGHILMRASVGSDEATLRYVLEHEWFHRLVGSDLGIAGTLERGYVTLKRMRLGNANVLGWLELSYFRYFPTDEFWAQWFRPNPDRTDLATWKRYVDQIRGPSKKRPPRLATAMHLVDNELAPHVVREVDQILPQALIRLQQFHQQSATSLEEIQSVFNKLIKDPSVRQTLLDKQWVPLDAQQVQAMGFQAVGGFIIADSAKFTDASHAVIADEDLTNGAAEKVLAWLKAGKGAPEVVKHAKLMKARRGDLLLLKAEPGLTAGQVKRLLSENGIEGAEAARAAIGDNAQIKNLSVFAFQLLANQEGLPPVIVLSVAVRLRDEAGNAYTLVLMA